MMTDLVQRRGVAIVGKITRAEWLKKNIIDSKIAKSEAMKMYNKYIW